MIRHRFPRFLVAIAIILSVSWVGWMGLTGNDFASAASGPLYLSRPSGLVHTGPVEQVPPIDERNLKWMGVDSCATSSCHHNTTVAQGNWRNAHGTWTDCDPHSKAYQVLFSERSKRMVKLYTKGRTTLAHKERLCLKCHAMNNGSCSNVGPMFNISDGVGCESCHGPAEKWLTRHYEADWDLKSTAEKAALGFRSTKDIRIRAKNCATCHVGDVFNKQGPNDPTMQVNHDLIAAGHPWLSFEFASYHALYPKHWGSKGPGDADYHPDRLRSDLPVQLWKVGQLVSAQSSLELLQHRAEQANKKECTPSPWPEFSEYTCWSCHKDLKPSVTPPRHRRPGTYPWNTWYMSIVRDSKVPGNSPTFTHQLEHLSQLMANPTPDERKVAHQVKQVLPFINSWLARENGTPNRDAGRVNSLFHLFVHRGAQQSGQMQYWDEAAQQYLAVAAMYNGVGEVQFKNYPPVRKELLQIKGKLKEAFPKNTNSPGKYAPHPFMMLYGNVLRKLHTR